MLGKKRALLASTAAATLLVGADIGCSIGGGLPEARNMASVSGAVADSTTGQAVVGASIRLQEKSATSDSSGRFYLDAVHVGEHTIVVEAHGYQTLTIAIMLDDGSNSVAQVLMTREGGISGGSEQTGGDGGSGQPDETGGGFEGPPNIMMFNVEDSSAKRYGVYGGPAKTPNLEKLAATGVVFNNAIVQASVCNPSRTAWLTGLRPTTSRVFSNSQDWLQAVDMVEATLPEHLRNHGYETVQAGKLFHKSFRGGIHASSFDRTIADKVDEENRDNSAPFGEEIKWGKPDIPPEETKDGHLAANVIEYLEEVHDKPFFLGIGLKSPHTAFSAPLSFYQLYDRDEIALPQGAPAGVALPSSDEINQPSTQEGWMDLYIAHLACISVVDWAVGQIMQALEDTGLADNTIVVFSTDHGLMLGEHGLWKKNSNKHWDETIRVPFIWRVPGVTPTGRRSDAMVEIFDSFPTFFDLAGIPPPPGQELEGISLRPVLEDPDASIKPAAFVDGTSNTSIVTNQYRLTFERGGEVLYLFDQENDPLEMNNLVDVPNYQAVIDELLQLYDT